jgi:dUTP pyrophosphatase
MLKVIFEKYLDSAKLPTKATPGSACFDVYAGHDAVVEWGKITIIDLGFKVKIPEGYEIVVRPRSGLAFKYGITITNSPGTIDSDYRGPMKIALTSVNKGYYIKTYDVGVADNLFYINTGDRIAQIALKKVEEYEFVEGKVDEDTSRGSGGFGSTGI